MIARSFAAPLALRFRFSTSSTWPGVVPYLTPASWQARASASALSRAARSTSVRGGLVMGMDFQVAVSCRERLPHCVDLSPSILNSRGHTTSATGTFPLTSSNAWAAGRPLMNVEWPPAFTAAM